MNIGDMKALADYVHGKGLKLGIYSSPGPKTCAGYIGSYQHEDQDVATWNKWGIDYLKYDLCSYRDIEKGKTLLGYQKPYVIMRQALDKGERDIVYSLCQYGMGDVWKWGGSNEVGGNCWRTSDDICDSWDSMSQNGFYLMDKGIVQYGQPGHWNDPDMLVVGRVGWGAAQHPSNLTPSEQVTHMTLWSMAAAPLLIGCDMSQMDKFTHDLLTNSEVLDIDQDPLGLPPVRLAAAGQTEVWARPLFDGSVAVALFNRGHFAQPMSLKFADLKRILPAQKSLQGKQKVRDLWRQKDLGVMDAYETRVGRHGAALIKIGTPRDD